MRKKMQKIIKHWKKISSLVSLTRHLTKFIFLEQLTAMPHFNMQNMFFFFFLFSFFYAVIMIQIFYFICIIFVKI